MTEETRLQQRTSKPGICDECGFRIEGGFGVHDRCKHDEDEANEIDETTGPPNPEQRPQRDNPNQCGCPNCTNSMMDEMDGRCMECFHHGCNYYSKWGVKCD